MCNKLFWTERALNEYDKLLDYLLEEWGIEITSKIISEIEVETTRIQHSPEQFPTIVKSRKIRRCVLSPQTSIFFKVEKETILILSLFDNRQNPKKLKL